MRINIELENDGSVDFSSLKVAEMDASRTRTRPNSKYDIHRSINKMIQSDLVDGEYTCKSRIFHGQDYAPSIGSRMFCRQKVIPAFISGVDEFRDSRGYTINISSKEIMIDKYKAKFKLGWLFIAILLLFTLVCIILLLVAIYVNKISKNHKTLIYVFAGLSGAVSLICAVYLCKILATYLKNIKNVERRIIFNNYILKNINRRA